MPQSERRQAHSPHLSFGDQVPYRHRAAHCKEAGRRTMCAAKSEESPERNVFNETPSHVTHGEYKKLWKAERNLYHLSSCQGDASELDMRRRLSNHQCKRSTWRPLSAGLLHSLRHQATTRLTGERADRHHRRYDLEQQHASPTFLTQHLMHESRSAPLSSTTPRAHP